MGGGRAVWKYKQILRFWPLVIPLFWLAAYLLNAAALDSDLHWTVVIDQKKSRIVHQIKDEPRILLVGGSHTFYSVSAEELEKLLHIKTINLGLHAGIGLNAILARSMQWIKANDLVVLFPEYGLLTNEGEGWLGAAYGAAIGSPTISGVGLEQKASVLLRSGTVNLTSFGKSLWVLFFGAKGRSAQATDVGPRGDTEVFLFDQHPSGLVLEDKFSGHAMERLIWYRDQIKQREAKLVIALPWCYVPEATRKITTERARAIADKLAKVAPVLTQNGLCNIQTDLSLFSDSDYHANAKGRSINSKYLASELRNIISTYEVHDFCSSHRGRLY